MISFRHLFLFCISTSRVFFLQYTTFVVLIVYVHMIIRSLSHTEFRSMSFDKEQSPTISSASTEMESSIVAQPVLAGILKSSECRSDTLRIDRSGTLIVAGSKSHRVCFADEHREQPIAKIHHVESLKLWNLGNRFDREHGCICTIS